MGSLIKVNAPSWAGKECCWGCLGTPGRETPLAPEMAGLAALQEFLKGKILNLFFPLMEFGALRWRVSSAFDVILIFLVLEVQGACCFSGCCRSWG